MEPMARPSFKSEGAYQPVGSHHKRHVQSVQSPIKVEVLPGKPLTGISVDQEVGMKQVEWEKKIHGPIQK